MAFGRLAFIDAFQKLPEDAPHGTNHAAYASCVGLARFGNFEGIDLFIEGASQIGMKGLEASALVLPRRIPVRKWSVLKVVGKWSVLNFDTLRQMVHMQI